MQYRTLGHSGTAVSRLALGTMYFGSETGEDEAFAILDAFLDAGGNLVDTSNVYVGGLAEEILGRWFTARPSSVTDRVVLATKGRFSPDPDLNATGSSRRALSRALDGSLRRLGRDEVDLYQLHAWDPLTPIEETLAFLDDAVHAGKVRYIGLSSFTGWQLQLTVSTAHRMGVTVPVTIQQQYSLLSRESEYEIAPAAAHNGLGLLPWSPLAGGFLTGKYQRGSVPAPGTRAGSDKALYQWVSAEYAGSDRTWDTIELVTKTAETIGASPAQVALAWLADRPAVTAPIVGARTRAQLEDTLPAADLHLDTEHQDALDEVSAPRPGTYPYGAFGAEQRARHLDGRDPLHDRVAAGSTTPLGAVPSGRA